MLIRHWLPAFVPLAAAVLGSLFAVANGCSSVPEQPFANQPTTNGSVSLAARAADTSQQGRMHGAEAMDRQEAELGKLLALQDWDQAPTGVDQEIWESLVPEDNEMTAARVELGRKLYFDTRLSRDNTVSCATCHDVTRGFTDQRMVSEGVGEKLGRRNAPTTMNAALFTPMFLDGRSPTLEHQAGQPILNPVEMAMPNREAVVEKLSKIEDYRQAFPAAYGREVNYADIERAIATFERTLVFLDSPFDRFFAGDDDAISEDAKKGWELFNGKARCATCHPINSSNPSGTDSRFHNVGVSARKQNFEKLAKQALDALAEDASEATLDRLAVSTDLSELGRFMLTKNRPDIGAFRTLQLRNVGITGPYMHDGSMHTLWDVMDHYNKGGEDNPYLDGGIEALALSEDEINQLVELMFTLTDSRFSGQNDAKRAEQRARAAKERPFRDTELAMRKKLGFEDRVMKHK